MKYYFTNLKKGFLKAYHLPILPDNINNLYQNIFVRIFRVIGGICVVVVLTKKHLILDFPLRLIVLILAFFQFVLMVFIGIVKLVFGIKKLINNPEDFEIHL